MAGFRHFVKRFLANEIVLAIIFALLIKAFIMDSRYVPSSSMHPTLQVNDRLLINKLSYKFGGIKAGDIVIFKPPASVDSKYDYVKRIVGLPGDTVEVTGGKLYLNGKPLEESYLNEPPYYELAPTTIPQDKVFVLGDNRNHSYDSHLWSEWLATKAIKGKVLFRYWPLQRIGKVK